MVTDLGSQNGTFVDGQQVPRTRRRRSQRVLRVGDSLLVPCADVRPFERAACSVVDGFVRGPAMQALLDEVDARGDASATSCTCAARAAPARRASRARSTAPAARARGPLRAPSTAPRSRRRSPSACCSAPRRGAYSGADATPPATSRRPTAARCSSTRSRELDAGGAGQAAARARDRARCCRSARRKPRKVDFGFVLGDQQGSARARRRRRAARGSVLPHRAARGDAAAAAQSARGDPALSRELPAVAPALAAHVSLVEQCLLRPWPGNVRELLAEVRAARAGRAQPRAHRVERAPPGADRRQRVRRRGATRRAPPQTRRRRAEAHAAGRRRVAASASRRRCAPNAGNVAGTARALGLHRTQLRRLLERHDIATDDNSSDSDE